MAIASQLKGEKERRHIAVIGDGAMTAGLAFEGLENAGSQNANILVVLNDNNMSIDPNIGALRDYLTKITTSHTFNFVRDEVRDLFDRIGKLGSVTKEFLELTEQGLKGILMKNSNLFESLHFRYF